MLASAAMGRLGVAVGLAVLLLANLARAEPPNRYGERGRTVLVTGLSGEVTGSGYTQSRAGWRASARVTLVHFVVNNFAIGGTLTGSLARLRDASIAEEPILTYGGGDIDVIGHVPLSRRLSLRFWGWFGLRHSGRRAVGQSRVTGDLEAHTQKHLQVVVGFTPALLLHLSSSTALEFGPSVYLYAPVTSNTDWDWSLNLGPNVSYSFGAPPETSEDSRAKSVVPRFAARGRNVLTGGASLGTDASGAFGYARFVTDHFALGPRLLGGCDLANDARPYWIGVGLQMLAELPLQGRWSLLFTPEVDYRYDRITPTVYTYSPSYGLAGYGGPETIQEIQISGSILPVFHLFESLVFGAGPSVTEHIRISSSLENLPTTYLSLGVTSLLAGSF